MSTIVNIRNGLPHPLAAEHLFFSLKQRVNPMMKFDNFRQEAGQSLGFVNFYRGRKGA